jgi:hypothetical protein
MIETIEKYLGSVSVGELQIHRSMAIVPILAQTEVEVDYSTLDEAYQEGVITVVEITKEGNVPNLKLLNRGPKMILIVDGEELVGAKQNRIVNVTMLIGANREIIIPVSCVERGRWSYSSDAFFSEGRMMSARLRKGAYSDVHDSLKRGRGYYPDQLKVWQNVSEEAFELGIHSGTEAMADTYRGKASAIDEYLKAFTIFPHQVGMVSLVNNKVVGVDSFGRSDTFSKMHRKLVSSYVLEAMGCGEDKSDASSLKNRAQEFLDRAKRGKMESHRSVDLGTDVRLEDDQMVGSFLAFERQILHLAIFPKDNGGSSGARIHGPSRRRDGLLRSTLGSEEEV